MRIIYNYKVNLILFKINKKKKNNNNLALFFSANFISLYIESCSWIGNYLEESRYGESLIILFFLDELFDVENLNEIMINNSTFLNNSVLKRGELFCKNLIFSFIDLFLIQESKFTVINNCLWLHNNASLSKKNKIVFSKFFKENLFNGMSILSLNLTRSTFEKNNLFANGLKFNELKF